MIQACHTNAAAGILALAGLVFSSACGRADHSQLQTGTTPTVRPSILLVTLDTTRADAIGPDANGIETPAFTTLASRGRRFRQAYATVPETLPSHSSMMTGLYPAGHGVHENARYLPAHHTVLAEQLQQAGYRTAAFISSFVLARRFGLARGFDAYDDELPAGHVERTSKETTDRALAYLDRASGPPLFMWVHYFDPHAPYAPPAPFDRQYANTPYLGEIAAMDQHMGRLVEGFEQRVTSHGGSPAIVIAGDHGEGLGEHGESRHGHLLYQSTMRVPMVLVGPGVSPGVSDTPVSTRRIFHTVLDWAGLGAAHSLRGPDTEVVLGEAMKPFLEYGWQPQIMAVEGRHKAILAGTREVYDVAADPGETRNLGAGASLPPSVHKALNDYPVPAPEAARVPENLSEEARRNLASLGYVSASAPAIVRKNAPRPAEMARLFDVIEKASDLFVQERYAQAIPLLEKILAEDPYNLDAALRLATAHSALGHDERAVEGFRKAAAIAPRSPDVRTYLALHYVKTRDWERAAPLLERIVSETPERLPAVEALAVIRERQGRLAEALDLRQKIYTMRKPTAAEMTHLGRLAMTAGRTSLAIESFEGARTLQRDTFKHDLELGVLYLAARRLEDGKAALDRVRSDSPEYPMALFKRAQVSVLLNEPDRAARIEQARRRADSTTRQLIAKERLFQSTQKP
ncbi:MAG: sulfatase-like hydrolase/transferase [Acidobacteria bacterium]|nr:sulfatase-like hydrolase/transferase [Acidobacteriota bacterium]MCA1651612.1 sulfatase-like hydrolase/transferase [Acidobacteriota bacterium]